MGDASIAKRIYVSFAEDWDGVYDIVACCGKLAEVIIHVMPEDVKSVGDIPASAEG